MPLSGLAVAEIGAGGVLLWSGISGTTVAATLSALLRGKTPQPPPTVTAANFNDIPGTQDSTATVTPSASQDAFIAALLHGLGAPDTPANRASLAAWMAREEPSADWAHWNNPFNTTLDAPGASSQNSVGVKAYPSLSAGLQATIDTLDSGAYNAIILALRSGNGLIGNSSPQVADELATWSGGGYTSVGG